MGGWACFKDSKLQLDIDKYHSAEVRATCIFSTIQESGKYSGFPKIN